MVLVYHGAIDDNPSEPTDVKQHHLKDALDALSAGKEITVKESEPIDKIDYATMFKRTELMRKKNEKIIVPSDLDLSALANEVNL